MGDRTSLTLAEGMEGMLENTFLNVKNRSKTIVAELDGLRGRDRGVILAQGGRFGGWVLYLENGRPAYTYNWFGLESYTVKSKKPLPKGKAEVKLEFAYDGGGTGKGGEATLYVNDEVVGKGRIDKTVPAVFSADETADVGKDDATQVANGVFKDSEDSELTARVDKVVISVSGG